MSDLRESVRNTSNELDANLVSFFTLLLEVDRRVNHSPVGGSDLAHEGKKEALAV